MEIVVGYGAQWNGVEVNPFDGGVGIEEVETRVLLSPDIERLEILEKVTNEQTVWG